MAEIVLPRYIIAQRCLWGGWRQPKKPKIPPLVTPAFNKITEKVDFTEINKLELNGFGLWEYRFWAAQLSLDGKSVIAECRECGSVFSNPIARRDHIGKMGCSKRLLAAFRLLLKDKVCVICNMRSYQEKWGVPLCSKVCIEAWCKVESQPEALAAALLLVRNGI